ncbi:hypothetical protein BGZ65_008952, partial [Modicella reniformis]
VRQIAIHNIVSFTPNSSGLFPVFLKHAKTLCKDLKDMVKEDTAIAHDALRSLINLSGEAVICAELDDETFIKYLIFDVIILKTNILADLGSMLLSNMCKSDNIATKILNLTGKPVEGLTTTTSAIGQLADIFLKGADKAYKPQCNFDFLASVFATLAADMEKMPEDIQLLPPTKKREVDTHLRVLILETLVLLTTTRHGRDYLREKMTYRVIQKMHEVETEDQVQEVTEQVVNMLMRDEAREIKEIQEIKPEDDEDAITE